MFSLLSSVPHDILYFDLQIFMRNIFIRWTQYKKCHFLFQGEIKSEFEAVIEREAEERARREREEEEQSKELIKKLEQEYSALKNQTLQGCHYSFCFLSLGALLNTHVLHASIDLQ